MTADMCHRDHGRHLHHHAGSGDLDNFYPRQRQHTLPPIGGVNGSPHVKGGTKHHPPCGEVAEKQNAPPPPHCPYVTVQHFHDHTAITHQRLAPRVSDRPYYVYLKGASGGLLYDWCGLGDINIYFLAHSYILLEPYM